MTIRESNAVSVRARLKGVYALVEPQRRELEPFVRALLEGGIRLFQVRAKDGISAERLTAIVELVRAAGGLTLVNDDVGLAELADGVHLGQEDAALHDLVGLRARLGQRVIGLSCGVPSEARAADPAVVDYVGVGPLFATGSKPDAGLPIGVSGARAVIRATTLPAAVIGGIDLAGIPRALETGARMAAVISACYAGEDAAETARALVAAWNR